MTGVITVDANGRVTQTHYAAHLEVNTYRWHVSTGNVRKGALVALSLVGIGTSGEGFYRYVICSTILGK